MITDTDIKKLKTVFATKDDLNQVKKVVDNLAVEVVDIKHDIAEMKENMTTKEETRQVLGMVESVLGEVKAMREEQSSHNLQHEDNDKEHKVFRKRLDKLEITSVVAHQIKIK
ncbi:MAG: hypothetical protein WCV81_05685 [Microgenomates group bacterium]|jgi:hypothetical protein